MITKERVIEIIEPQITEDAIFLVEVKVKSGNKIVIYIDGPNGVTIDYIKKISRLVEGSFDREIEDFELEVSSPGIGQPFKVPQQYKKCLGKPIKVTVSSEKIVEGILEEADETSFTVAVELMEKREGDKKKQLYKEQYKFLQSEVKSVVELIKF